MRTLGQIGIVVFMVGAFVMGFIYNPLGKTPPKSVTETQVASDSNPASTDPVVVSDVNGTVLPDFPITAETGGLPPEAASGGDLHRQVNPRMLGSINPELITERDPKKILLKGSTILEKLLGYEKEAPPSPIFEDTDGTFLGTNR